MRIFYCPRCGRVDEDDLADEIIDCPFCRQWYYNERRFTAKRVGES